jgi:hypothetical protein
MNGLGNDEATRLAGGGAVGADLDGNAGERGAAGRGNGAGNVVKLNPVRLPGPAASEAAALISMIERGLITTNEKDRAGSVWLVWAGGH